MKEVLIILNRGGWGDGGLERAREEKAVVEGIFNILQSQGWYCELGAHERLRSPTFLKYLKALWDLVLGYTQASRVLAKVIQTALKESAERRVVLVGYSLGAILTISTMKLLVHEPRLYSIQIGTPFFIHSPIQERVRGLRRKEDVFSSGPFLPFLLVLFQALIVLAANIGTFQGRSILDVWHIKGHDYAWDDPAVHIPIEQFLRSNFP